MSKLTKDGVSATTEYGMFQHDEFWSKVLRRMRVQWDYRAKDGTLYSGTAETVEQAKQIAANRSLEIVDDVVPTTRKFLLKAAEEMYDALVNLGFGVDTVNEMKPEWRAAISAAKDEEGV